MTTFKRLFRWALNLNEEQQLSKRVLLPFNSKREVWNRKRRFSGARGFCL